MEKATAQDVLRINALTPLVGRVTAVKDESPDVKTYRITTLDGQKPFTPMPGQLGMLSLPAVGEAMFSISDQTETELEMAIKEVGQLTSALHQLEVGQEVGIRGPYGNGFPMEELKGRDLLFVGGGIGLAPVRSVIMHCIRNRADYGKLTVIYGARSVNDLCFKDDLFHNWPAVENMDVHVTIDRAEDGWDGHVGFVPDYIKELAPAPQTAIICGPPVMIKFSLPALSELGFADENILTTLEMRMKCGVGKCGRCNIGHCYVCLDGPVFSQAELKKLPA